MNTIDTDTNAQQQTAQLSMKDREMILKAAFEAAQQVAAEASMGLWQPVNDPEYNPAKRAAIETVAACLAAVEALSHGRRPS